MQGKKWNEMQLIIFSLDKAVIGDIIVKNQKIEKPLKKSSSWSAAFFRELQMVRLQ